MKSGRESQLWSSLKRHCSNEITVMRVEVRTRGFPDVLYSGPCANLPEYPMSGLLELKQLTAVFDPQTSRIPWQSNDQPLWLFRWAQAGGTCGVLLRDVTKQIFYWRARPTVTWYRSMLGSPLPGPDLQLPRLDELYATYLVEALTQVSPLR